MATETATKEELEALEKQFRSLLTREEQTAFLHENPKLQQLISVIHFPKPVKATT